MFNVLRAVLLQLIQIALLRVLPRQWTFSHNSFSHLFSWRVRIALWIGQFASTVSVPDGTLLRNRAWLTFPISFTADERSLGASSSPLHSPSCGALLKIYGALSVFAAVFTRYLHSSHYWRSLIRSPRRCRTTLRNTHQHRHANSGIYRTTSPGFLILIWFKAYQSRQREERLSLHKKRPSKLENRQLSSYFGKRPTFMVVQVGAHIGYNESN